jgi:CheY-like chemotaxis protein
VTDRRWLEEQSRLVQKMQAVGQLAGSLAHDFNNLLTAILAHNELLEQENLSDVARADLLKIRKASETAAVRTRQLLAVSRKQESEPERVDLNRIVQDAEAMLRPVVGHGVRLVLILAPRPVRVRIDSGRLLQLLLNLAANARDAMAEGGSLIIETANVRADADVAYAGAPPAGRYAALIVSDSGTGMSDEAQARLFEPFFTTKEPGKNAGLGLSTVHGIVTQSGGHILVQSGLGRGTTFRILLPSADGVSGPVEPITGRTAGTETILVAEDQTPVRTLVERVLVGLGYTVLQAGSAAEAEMVAGQHDGPIDLLITSLKLDGAKGPELAQRLVADRPGLDVLYTSSHTADATIVGLVSSRVTFLHKPFTPERLGQTVRQILDQPERRPAPHPQTAPDKPSR